MKIADALRGVRQLGIDSAPLIYLVEKHPTYFDQVVFIMRHIHNGSIDGVASVLALTEVLVHPLRTGNQTLAQDYENILLNSTGFRLVPVDTNVARQSADLRARYNLRTPDALHIATALEAGCEAFLTNDLALKRVTEVRVLALDELEL